MTSNYETQPQAKFPGLPEAVPPDQPESRPRDQAGVADLFHARHLELVRLATLLVGDRATAEDVVQDVFVSVCARWQRLTENGVAVSYFRTAVVNACRSVHRRRGIARRLGRGTEAALWAEPEPSAESAALLAEDRRKGAAGHLSQATRPPA